MKLAFSDQAGEDGHQLKKHDYKMVERINRLAVIGGQTLFHRRFAARSAFFPRTSII